MTITPLRFFFKGTLPLLATFFCLGLSSGLPYSLIYSTAALWLNEANIPIATVTLFSFALLPYAFKVFWAPLVDTLPLWHLHKLGQRRAWLIFTQAGIILSIISMALFAPDANTSLLPFALFACCLGIFSATQDIVIDAYRIESVKEKEQGSAISSYQFGYRFALLLSGAGVLWLSNTLGSSTAHYSKAAWQISYLAMSLFACIGLVTTLIIKEHAIIKKSNINSSLQFLVLTALVLLSLCFVFKVTAPIKPIFFDFINPYLKNNYLTAQLFFLCQLALLIGLFFVLLPLLRKQALLNLTAFNHAYVAPITAFLKRYPKKTTYCLLLIISTYRLSDQILVGVANLFYQDLGFSKDIIAAYVKTFGLCMTLIGIAVGGFLVKKTSLFKLMLLGAILAASTNLLFIGLTKITTLSFLALVITADNLSAGIASVAFVSFLSYLTDIKFTATQFALFTSIMALLPRIIGGYSGGIIAISSYETFFFITFLLGLPLLLLLVLIKPIFSK